MKLPTQVAGRWTGPLHVLLLGVCLSTTLPAQAQTQLNGDLLGLSETDLQARVSALHRNGKPLPGPHGSRGVWSRANTAIAGLTFETTFYLRDKRVARVEHLRISTGSDCSGGTSFSTLVADTASRLGTGLPSSDPPLNGLTQQSVIWVAGAFDVRVLQSQSASQCAIRVVYEAHIEKDASAL